MTKLLRVHGSENSFFLLDQTELQQKMTQNELIELTKDITQGTNKLLGGVDGVLVVDDSTHSGALGSMTVINSDGSIASMCGNGLRTVTRYLGEKYEQDEFVVETQQSDLRVGRATDLAPDVQGFHVEISPVNFELSSLPMNLEGQSELFNEPVEGLSNTLKFSAVSVPNPHLISIEHDENNLSRELLGQIGEYLNGDNPWFKDGVNVSFGTVWGPHEIFVQTFERGVGFTNACGTGMSAASLVWTMLQDGMTGFGELNTVYNPGGMVQTRINRQNDDYSIDLIGNATFTHEIEISESDLRRHAFNRSKIVETNEEEAYKLFVEGLHTGN